MGYRVEETIEADTKSSAADLIATRVNGESIEVLAGDLVPIGEWAAFELKLSGGEVFLEGMGRCEACASSGAGYRVRLGTLQFDVMNEVMFERVHLAAESMMTGERTGEVDIAALEALRKAEQAPRPSPSVAALAPSPTKISAPMNTPSWRPPPPMRSGVKAPAPSSPPPHSSAPAPKTAPRAPTSIQPPHVPRPKISMNASPPPPLAPIGATRTNVSAPGEFTPSGFPPPLRPRPAAIAPPAPAFPTPVPTPAPAAAEAKPSTVSGFPAPPPESSPPKSAPSIPAASRASSLPPTKDAEAASATRARLEPLLLAMRRGGAARHIEDAEELAMELGLQALERIFGD